MNIEKKLDVWTKEKLITDIQKKAVLAYEERLKAGHCFIRCCFSAAFASDLASFR